MTSARAGHELDRLHRGQCHFYFSPDEPPQVRLAPGARIVVETENPLLQLIADARGPSDSLDSRLRNDPLTPLTGPIYVEGVAPADCISVHIEEIVAGPVDGQAWTLLVPGEGGLESLFSIQPPLEPERVLSHIRQRTVFFPTHSGVAQIPLAPFLGNVGVAPSAERRISDSQGPDFLGNIDLPLLCPGATIVLRANVAGALLSLGDARAAQGDGLIAGSAISCQADITLTIDRLPHETAQYALLPQVNTSAFIGSIAAFGGTSTADLIRAAYRDLVERLVRFHEFSMPQAYLLLSQVGRVTIGQVLGPLYSAAVTLDRRYLL